MLPRPLQHRQVAASCGCAARPLVRGTALLPCPLQHCQVAAVCCSDACPLVPGAALLPRPLQHCQVAAECCTAARQIVPGAAVLPSPLQHCQVAAECCMAARIRIPIAALLPRPLQHCQVAAFRGRAADAVAVPQAALLAEHPGQRGCVAVPGGACCCRQPLPPRQRRPLLLHCPQGQRVCITVRTPPLLLQLPPPLRRPGPPLAAQAADAHALHAVRQPLKHERQHAGVPQRLCRAGGAQPRPRARDRRHSLRPKIHRTTQNVIVCTDRSHAYVL
jgi:hypothetical protein